jgi:hypothetical protein
MPAPVDLPPMRIPLPRRPATGAALLACAVLAGCGSPAPAGDVPAGPGAAGGTSTGRAAALHAAAQCIRSHGIPTYQDPVLTASGQVYTDARSIQDYARAHPGGDRGGANPALDAIRRACLSLITTAGLQPEDQAPAPPRLVAAGVRAARCLRAHGLPNYRDPTGATPFTPGHGFGITADEMPGNGAGGKSDPTFQAATTACRAELDAEITASQLSNLADG